ncbi:GAF domain-containing protein [Colwellia sp. MSW7]|uniref:GAF domain-containing protein n=1 Tax=Colwellia maritima TaxID=2912588 RepID=A0ABS9WXY4_9GAMM|nr:GAF domain-containing protein [Colwellia maritima]MCI2282818.1 GAF domain-containing protein [Colwellia maritima]
MTNAQSKKFRDTIVDNKKAQEHDAKLLMLQDKYDNLQLRYSALFNLNRLSQECDDLNYFYPQVHSTIRSLMTAENFFIVTYDQTFSTLEFVYYVDEKDEGPVGIIDYHEYEGSFTSLIIDSAQPLLITPELVSKLQKNGKIKQYGTGGTDWLGVPLLHNDLVIGVMVVQSYTEETRYSEQELNMLTFAGQHVVGAMVRLQDKERLTSAVNARTQELMAQIREREKSELLQESLYRISELANDATLISMCFIRKCIISWGN